MPRVRSPKRGSKAFSPRKRTRNIFGRINFWPEIQEGPKLLGFAGYKAGMTHLFLIEDRRRSPDYGNEVKNAVTIIDAPPIFVVAVRAYSKEYNGLKVLTEAWMEELPVDLLRRVKTFIGGKPEIGFKKMEDQLNTLAQFRVIVATQPRLVAVSNKKPELVEIAIGGGSQEEKFNYVKGLLGKTINVSQVFNIGESIDVMSVTKGKGFQGPVKRWGIRILQHKSRKTKRGVASIGPWKPRRVMPTVPRAGQMGFHNRTEHNKRILLIGSDGEKITPKGGFNGYGRVKGDFIILKGSVMGSKKRLIKLRKAARKSRYPSEQPQITNIHTEFLKQIKEI